MERGRIRQEKYKEKEEKYPAWMSATGIEKYTMHKKWLEEENKEKVKKAAKEKEKEEEKEKEKKKKRRTEEQLFQDELMRIVNDGKQRENREQGVLKKFDWTYLDREKKRKTVKTED
jgi:hypothetical protein